MGQLVGVISEENTRRAAGVCSHKAHREASFKYSFTEEDHVVVAGRSIDGR